MQCVAIVQRLKKEIIWVQEFWKHMDIEITKCDLSKGKETGFLF